MEHTLTIGPGGPLGPDAPSFPGGPWTETTNNHTWATTHWGHSPVQYISVMTLYCFQSFVCLAQLLFVQIRTLSIVADTG